MRFQTKLLVIFAALFGIALLTRLFITFDSQKQIVSDITKDIRNVIQVVHFSTQRLSSEKERDKAALTRFITDATQRNDAINEISIININQEIIASSDPSKIGKRQPELWQEKMINGQFYSKDTLDCYEVSIPIQKDQKIIGHVLASILVNDAGAYLNDLYYKNIIISIFLFLGISIVSYFAIHRITKPLQGLSAASKTVASGDLSVKIKVAGNDELSEVASSFNTMTEKLLEQKGYETRFRDMERHVILSETASTLAHEIRNPLNLINLTAGHLAHDFLPRENSQRDDYLNLIENLKAQVKHLNTMVNDFLTIGKPLKLNKTSFNLIQLIGQVEMLIKQRMILKELKLVVNVQPDIQIYADLEQMRLVLLNLFINAIEASKKGQAVSISAHTENTSIVIKITDNGTGIAPEDLGKIFEPYYTKRAGGTGLGLTLVRRIVEEHSGSIKAENIEKSGACFTLTLPLKG